MKTVEPGEFGYSYDNLVASFEIDVLVSLDEQGYQGDTLTLLRDGERFGLLEFGWGSCSGCDALESVEDTPAKVTELRDDLWNSVHWEDSAQQMAQYLDERDWAGTFINAKLVSDFRQEANKVLPAAAAKATS